MKRLNYRVKPTGRGFGGPSEVPPERPSETLIKSKEKVTRLNPNRIISTQITGKPLPGKVHKNPPKGTNTGISLT